MIGEIWTYKAIKPNDNLEKTRPVLIIGDDDNNGLSFCDIHYVIVSSSAEIGIYDIEINDILAKEIGLIWKSVIKTTKIFTGSKYKLGKKICDLPDELKEKFITNYKNYQLNMINKFSIENY